MLERLFPQQSDDKLMVEDCFSCFLYTGNGSTQTITNGINLSGQGGLVWSKARSSATGHNLFDTARGRDFTLYTNLSDGQFGPSSATQDLTSFNNNGFSLGTPFNSNVNSNTVTYASWTFRKAPKFFDVVTYTGNGSIRTIAHNLGVAPGMIIIKSISEANIWVVYHRSIGATKYMVLNVTQGESTYSPYFNNTEPTASVFTLGNDNSDVNKTGTQFVAYLFAHDPSADGIIQCGSYTGNGDDIGPTITLGWEPQWLLIKRATASENWVIYDNMRGVPTNGIDAQLSANLSSSEQLAQNRVDFTATGFIPRQGFTTTNSLGDTYIYIAIRRGPMRTPTLGTSVFSPSAYTGTGTVQNISANFPADMAIAKNRDSAVNSWFYTLDRMRGKLPVMSTNDTSAEFFLSDTVGGGFSSPIFDVMSGITYRGASGTNYSGFTYVAYQFRRAPGFMDVVCYTGNGTANQSINHSLGVTPELVIVKRRSASEDWYAGRMSGGIPVTEMRLNTNAASVGNVFVFPVSQTQITVNYTNPVNGLALNSGGSTYVAYLFASAPGVSKVGSYTGNGSSQTINCAFTTGARFVMIKRTDSTGDWYVWDSARGIVAGNDPYLALNTSAAEVTSDDSVDTDNTGFVVNQVAASNINVNAATYIFLAIA